MKTAIIIATGPSLTRQQLAVARKAMDKGVLTFGMNRVFQDFPELDVFLSCNPEFYDAYWDRGLSELRADKWSWDYDTAQKYGINHIIGRWEHGLSTDSRYVHLGHSSGFQLPGIAYHYGVRRMLLIGYDMAFAPDYNGKNRQVGSRPRHYFGEYEPELQHWPSVKVKNGVFVELIEQFERVKAINTDVEIINCTPGSAMTCFPMMSLEEALDDSGIHRH